MLSCMSGGVVDVNRVHKGWNECGKVGTPRVEGWCERVHQHRNGMERWAKVGNCYCCLKGLKWLSFH